MCIRDSYWCGIDSTDFIIICSIKQYKNQKKQIKNAFNKSLNAFYKLIVFKTNNYLEKELAFSPAILPKTVISTTAFPPNLLEPCIPPVTSPAA